MYFYAVCIIVFVVFVLVCLAMFLPYVVVVVVVVKFFNKTLSGFRASV